MLSIKEFNRNVCVKKKNNSSLKTPEQPRQLCSPRKTCKLLLDFNKILDEFWGDPLETSQMNSIFSWKEQLLPGKKPHAYLKVQINLSKISVYFKECQPNINKKACRNKKTTMPQSSVE